MPLATAGCKTSEDLFRDYLQAIIEYVSARDRYAAALAAGQPGIESARENLRQSEAAVQQGRDAIVRHQREHGCAEPGAGTVLPDALPHSRPPA